MKKLLFLLAAISFLLSSNVMAQEKAPTPDSADKIVKLALSKAKKENKNVIIMWHASWCGWCHRMDSLMMRDDMKEYFPDNYVIEHLVVKESKDNKHLENPGADTMLAKYLGDKSGIPFWIVLDAKGKLVSDSFMRKEGVGMDQPGDNTGCPANPDEVDHLLNVLKKSSDIDQAGLDKVKEVFIMKR